MVAKKYKILRIYQDDRGPRVMRRDLTLAQAREHCSDPETSSMSAKRACNNNPDAIERWHEKRKHWFDSFTEQ